MFPHRFKGPRLTPVRSHLVLMAILLWLTTLVACDPLPLSKGGAEDLVPTLDAGEDTAGEHTIDALDGVTGEDAPSDTNSEMDTEDVGVHPFADSLFLSDAFLNIAHRGGALVAPEETIVAYTKALSLGADVIECDVHATSDGVLVCMHDGTVDRTTDGSGAIKSMTIDEVLALDAGYWFTEDGETYPYRGVGVQVATLDTLLGTFDDTYVAIEIKAYQPSIVDALIAVVDANDAAHRIEVASFSDVTIAEFRSARPDIITALALNEMLEFERLTDAREARYSPPGLILEAPDAEVLTAELVARVHRLGMRVQVWTVNTREDMERVMELGVDGIITDDPATLDAVINGL